MLLGSKPGVGMGSIFSIFKSVPISLAQLNGRCGTQEKQTASKHPLSKRVSNTKRSEESKTAEPSNCEKKG
jgi:hypothetical protein